MADIVPPTTPGASPLTAVSLFAGVGGIDLALSRAGVSVTAAVEIDDAARGVIADRLPETTLFTDVTKVTADELRATGFVPERGIIAAGWPCQGNSVAGRRGGLADPRSGLWPHVVRLLAELRPRWFLGENVPGLLSVTDGEDFGICLGDLAELGMGFCWRVLDAQFFGVPQRRRRVFVVGCAGDERRPVQVLLEPEGRGGHHPPSRPKGTRIARTLEAGANQTGGTRPPLAIRGREEGAQLEVGPEGGPYNALRAGDGGSSRQSVIAFAWQAGGKNDASGAFLRDMSPTLPKSQTMAVQTETAVRRLTPRECERLQGFPDDWTATSNGKAQADSARYRQMGNAVAVPCVEWIASRIVTADKGGVA